MEAMRTARRRLRRLKRQLQMGNDSIDRLIIRYSGRIISLPTRRVGNLLLFPCPELGEQGLDVRGPAHDRVDDHGPALFCPDGRGDEERLGIELAEKIYDCSIL